MATYTPLYDILPPTPSLPPARFEGTAPINGIDLWYGLYGRPLGSGPTPVVFLHGGKINANWWGLQVRHVSQSHPVIAVDTRAHGRSSDDPNVPFSYDLFADDMVALLAHLEVPKASFVGWSDGANTSVSLAMRYSDKAERVFAFGANYQPDQVNLAGISGMPFLKDLGSRMTSEYAALSPEPARFECFMAKMKVLQDNLPSWNREDFDRIKSHHADPAGAPIVWIVNGDSEEMVQQRAAPEMRDLIKDSSLVILPEVGHIAPLQDPDTFNAMLDRWLSRS